MSIIEESIKTYTPHATRCMSKLPQFKSNPWWNEECENLVRKTAFLKVKYLNTRENFFKYKQADNNARSYFKTRKKQYFLKFCDSFGRASNMKYIWSKIRAMNNKFHRKEASNFYNDKAVSAMRNQIESLGPPWCPTEPPDIVINIDATQVPFTLEEVILAIDNTNSKSSLDLDGIDYYTLKLLPWA